MVIFIRFTQTIIVIKNLKPKEKLSIEEYERCFSSVSSEKASRTSSREFDSSRLPLPLPTIYLGGLQIYFKYLNGLLFFLTISPNHRSLIHKELNVIQIYPDKGSKSFAKNFFFILLCEITRFI